MTMGLILSTVLQDLSCWPTMSSILGFFLSWTRKVIVIQLVLLMQVADELRLLQQKEQLSRRLSARYVPGGRAQKQTLNRSSLDTCLLQLHMTLSHDWPASFVQVSIASCILSSTNCKLKRDQNEIRIRDQKTIESALCTQVFEDIPGCLVLSFHKHLAALEGDITTYMNQHYRTDITVQSFKLVKDTLQWAVTTDDGDPEIEWGVFFVYWPPWATRPKLIPDHLAGPRPSQDVISKQKQTQGWPSKRTPFGTRTNAGQLMKYDTRSHEHTMVSSGGSLFGRV
jgi:hypothetical protein